MVRVLATATTAVYMLILFVIGIMMYRFAGRSERDYWIAGGQTRFAVNTPAVMSVLISGGSFLGVAGLAYESGALIATAFMIGVLAGVFLLIVLFSYPYRRSGAMTFPDFMTFLFQSKRVRVISALVFGIYAFGYLVPQFLGGGIVFSFLLDTPPNLSIAIMGVVVFIYVAFGGFWAVTWTDFVQGILLTVTMLSIGLVVLVNFGGFLPLWKAALDIKPAYGTASINQWFSGLGLVITWMLAIVAFPANVSRVFSSADPRTASRSFSAGLIIYALFHIMTIAVIGAAAIVYAPDGLQTPDLAFIVVMKKYTSGIISGVISAGILSALMSSADSLFMAALAALTHDVYKEIFNPDITDQRIVRISRMLAVVLGVGVVILTIYTPGIIGVIASIMAGWGASTIFGPMVIGTWWRSTTPNGVNAGMLSGGIVYLILTFSGTFPQFTQTVFSVLVSVVITIGVSLYENYEPSEPRKNALKIIHNPEETINNEDLSLTYDPRE